MIAADANARTAPPPPQASSRNRGWDGATIDIYKGAGVQATGWPAPPDLWVRPHDVRHSPHWHGEGPVVVLAHLPASLLEQATPAPRALARPLTGNGNDAFVADICRLMATEIESPPHPVQAMIWQNLSSALAIHLAHRFGRPKAGPADPGSGLTAAALFNGAMPFAATSPRQERAGGLALWQELRAKELLANRLSGPVSIGEIAAACELSRTHFSRAFKATMGQTPHQWLTALRIERAKCQLLGSKLALPEIATDCGFSDQSHFTRVFAAWTGASPRSWQRRHQA